MRSVGSPVPAAGQVWSTQVQIPVTSGVRRISLLPTPSGSVLVVDSTGASGYGQLVLGEVRPLRGGLVRAVSPQGVDIGSGTTVEMVTKLFDTHPARADLLDCGVDRCVDGDSGLLDTVDGSVAAIEEC